MEAKTAPARLLLLLAGAMSLGFAACKKASEVPLDPDHIVWTIMRSGIRDLTLRRMRTVSQPGPDSGFYQ